MDTLQWDLAQLCKRNKDGSFGVQANRRKGLDAIARELKKELGFVNMRATSLKPKHVEALVRYWQEQEIKPGTMKNRMAWIRWWAEKIGNPAVVPNENAKLGIPDRQYVAETGKQTALSEDQRNKIQDERIQVSLLLEAAFGLRGEEAMKFRPEEALRGADPASADRIYLKASWCKGGRAREVPICHEFQREALAMARKVAGGGSLIPPEKSYVQHLGAYRRAVKGAGLTGANKPHGLRHAYAQRRYLELTGRPAPHAGGPRSKALTPEQKAQDEAVRLAISEELGHGREEVSAVYLGR
jgi:integrase